MLHGDDCHLRKMKSYTIVGFVLFVCLNTSYAQLPGSPEQRAQCSPPFRATRRRGFDRARVAGDDKKYVRFVYLVSSDKHEKPEYRPRPTIHGATDSDCECLKNTI